MSKYVKVTLIYEPDNGSTLDIDELYKAVKESMKYLAPEPNPGLTVVEILDTENDNAN